MRSRERIEPHDREIVDRVPKPLTLRPDSLEQLARSANEPAPKSTGHGDCLDQRAQERDLGRVTGDAHIDGLEDVLLSGRLQSKEKRGLADPSGCEQQDVVGLEPVPELGLLCVAVEEVLALDRWPDAVSNLHAAVVGPGSWVLQQRGADHWKGVLSANKSVVKQISCKGMRVVLSHFEVENGVIRMNHRDARQKFAMQQALPEGDHMRMHRLFVLAGLAAALALAGPLSSARANTRTHVVEPGDTLWELAEDNGCTVEQLREANDLTPEDPIVVGSTIDLSACPGAPRAKQQSASSATYVVVSGDSLAAIARRHGTTVAELRELNSIEGSVIKIGQRLRVPGEATRTVRLLTGQSRGRPGHGWLHRGTQLPQSSHYFVVA